MSYLAQIDPMVLAAERTLAAYLGFDDIVQMQRFLITWRCLETWSLAQRFLPLSEETIFPPFNPSDFEGQSENGSQLLLFLRSMARDIHIYINSPDAYNVARTARAMARMPSGPWIPDFVPEEVALFPILNPIQSYQEDELMPLHRCLALLQYFDLTHGSEARRAEYLELRRRVPREEFVVTFRDTPGWMAPGP
ncbi:unnamed protein product [Penicillium bialowiezense]